MKTLNKLLVSAAFLPSMAMSQELTFATAGGVWLETITEACLDPYAESADVEVEVWGGRRLRTLHKLFRRSPHRRLAGAVPHP